MEAEGKRCGVFGLCMSAYEIARGELSGDERPGSGSDDLVDASSVAMRRMCERVACRKCGGTSEYARFAILITKQAPATLPLARARAPTQGHASPNQVTA